MSVKLRKFSTRKCVVCSFVVMLSIQVKENLLHVKLPQKWTFYKQATKIWKNCPKIYNPNGDFMKESSTCFSEISQNP